MRTTRASELWPGENPAYRVIAAAGDTRAITPPVAPAAVWLAADQSDYVHGTTIYIDGGMALYPDFIGAG